MIDTLSHRLRAMDKVIEDLAKAEEAFLNLEASEKPLYAVLYLKTKGTVGEREAQVYASPDWDNLTKALVPAKIEVQKLKRKLELNFKAFDAEYLSQKIDSNAIRSQRGVT